MFPDALAQSLLKFLQHHHCQIVFAESCTAGLISASMARIPGMSAALAGSSVVYQIPVKQQWLGIPDDEFRQSDVVSENISRHMAVGVLKATERATMGVSITGHLGPDAPPELDGVAWTSIAVRRGKDSQVISRQLDLKIDDKDSFSPLETRRNRQFTAVRLVLEFCHDYFEELQVR